jgi:hypothetical protein
MRQSAVYCLALTMILTLHGPTGRPILAETRSFNPEKPDLKVHVRLYNYASVTPEGLAKMKEQASVIFRQVRVDVVWVEDAALQQGSGAPAFEEIDLFLRILPQPRATLASRSALGEALPCQLRRDGCIASVFLNRAKQLADRTGMSVHQVLGHAMAHELGHLLLGSNSHSGWGLMRAVWNSQDIQRAAKGALLFTSVEAEVIGQKVLAQIQQKVLARIQQQETLQASASAR